MQFVCALYVAHMHVSWIQVALLEQQLMLEEEQEKIDAADAGIARALLAFANRS